MYLFICSWFKQKNKKKNCWILPHLYKSFSEMKKNIEKEHMQCILSYFEWSWNINYYFCCFYFETMTNHILNNLNQKTKFEIKENMFSFQKEKDKKHKTYSLTVSIFLKLVFYWMKSHKTLLPKRFLVTIRACH